MHVLGSLLAFMAAWSCTAAHIYMTYPGWRGDNFVTNGTYNVDEFSSNTFPYGMQWMYPCGGMPISSNRTKWPITGGAVSFEPGWFPGHLTAFLYVNIGLGNVPVNYSHNVVPVFQVNGPTNDAYPGLSVCLPQVPLPANVTFRHGDNVTIQVVMNAKHGASLFSCVDVTLTDDMSQVAEVNSTNCQNSTDLSFSLVFATTSLSSGAPAPQSTPRILSVLSTVVFVIVVAFIL